MENKNNNYFANINRLVRFFEKTESGYAFAVIENQRKQNEINKSLQQLLAERNIRVAAIHFDTQSEQPLVEQLRKQAKRQKAIIVNNLSELVRLSDKQNERDFLLELNFAREEILALQTPVLFWLTPETMSTVSNRAADLYTQRRRNNVYFDETPDDKQPAMELQIRFDETFRSSEEFAALETKLKLQKRQLHDAEKGGYPKENIARHFALPLAKTYSDLDLHKEAFQILDRYREVLDKDNYELQKTTGDIYFAAKQYEKAERAYQQALQIAQKKNDQYAQSYLTLQLSDLYEETGKLNFALKKSEESLKIRQELNDKHFISIAYERLGTLYTALGKLDLALDNYQKEHDLTQELYAANPKNESLKNGLAISYSKLGEVYSDLGKLDLALENYQKYHDLTQELYAANPKNESLKNGLAISFCFLGNTYQSLGKSEKALQHYKLYYQHSFELYTNNHKNEKLKNDLAISYSKLGNVYSALGKLDLALENYQKEIVLFKELYAANPKNESLKNGLAISYDMLGVGFSMKKNTKEAVKNFEKAIEIGKECVKDNPKSVNLQDHYAIFNLSLIVAKLMENEAIEIPKEIAISKKIWEELYEISPVPKYKEKLELLKKIENKEGNYEKILLEITK